MNFLKQLLIVGLLFMTLNGFSQKNYNEKPEARNERMKWWQEARFGMFIHWGVYAIPARGEWVMNKEKISVPSYAEYVHQFNPVNYNAEEWVQTAKKAGMKYIVITAKHHDGFALWGTKYSKWNVVDATPNGKDLLRPLAEACQREGIRLGFYYSQAQDWLNGGSARNGKWDPLQERPMNDYIDSVAVPQVRELLTAYGKGTPALLWWDTPDEITQESAQKFANAVQELAPTIIMNGRLGGNISGDFDSPEGFIPASKPSAMDWETCMTMNRSWGFNKNDEDWKSSKTLIRQLCDIASKGGNYILNIGPKADGQFPKASMIALKEMGEWMNVNNAAIYGTQASPFPYPMPWGNVTRKDNTLYLMIFNWPEKGKLEVPLLNTVIHSSMLDKPTLALKVVQHAGGFTIQLPKTAPKTAVTVVAVEIFETPKIGKLPPRPRGPVIPQTEDGSIHLAANDADIQGPHIGFNNNMIVGWSDPNSSATWRADIKKPGRFRVSMNYAVPLAWAGSTLKIKCEKDAFVFNVEATKSFHDYETRVIGELQIDKKGEVELLFEMIKIFAGGSVGNLRSIELFPIKNQ